MYIPGRHTHKINKPLKSLRANSLKHITLMSWDYSETAAVHDGASDLQALGGEVKITDRMEDDRKPAPWTPREVPLAS